MSSTVRDLVDRTFREYLEPADELNSYTAVASTLRPVRFAPLP